MCSVLINRKLCFFVLEQFFYIFSFRNNVRVTSYVGIHFCESLKTKKKSENCTV